MVGGGPSVFREEHRPDLIEHWFFGRVVMHRVAYNRARLLRAFRMWLGVSECGVMTREPIPGTDDVTTWCPKCFPGPAGPVGATPEVG
jgi:hypothetical protein